MLERDHVDAWARIPPRRSTRCGGDREHAFTIVEMIVVLLIVAMLTAIALPTLGRTRAKSDGPLVNTAAGAVWRGVENYRMDNHGGLPPAGLLTGAHATSPAGSTFVSPGNTRYVERWPDGKDGAPVRVFQGNGAPPTASISNSDPRAGHLEYAMTGAAATPQTGWLVGYASTGAIVYRRSIEATVAGAVPAG